MSCKPTLPCFKSIDYFTSIEQIIVVLTAPSNTVLEEPFVFMDFAPKQTASEWLPNVFREVFQPSLLTQLARRANYPTELVILSGGGFWKIPDVHGFLLALGTRCGLYFSQILIVSLCRAQLSEIIGFGHQKLVPAFMQSFLMHAMQLKHYQQSPSFLRAAFEGQGQLGSHTDVYILQPQSADLFYFTWAHPG